MPYGPPLYGIFWGHLFYKYGGWGWSVLFSGKFTGTPLQQFRGNQGSIVAKPISKCRCQKTGHLQMRNSSGQAINLCDRNCEWNLFRVFSTTTQTRKSQEVRAGKLRISFVLGKKARKTSSYFCKRETQKTRLKMSNKKVTSRPLKSGTMRSVEKPGKNDEKAARRMSLLNDHNLCSSYTRSF